MNIWIEYFKKEESRKNTHAQIREKVNWVPPDPKDIHRRFCLDREHATTLAKSLNEQGYHVIIKTDGMGNL
tara:strand:+ start:1078 stop:1290 length:213 start_codon:yes stop_codon:yes gene_type:complete